MIKNHIKEYYYLANENIKGCKYITITKRSESYCYFLNHKSNNIKGKK